jgi:hypothetical protein
MEPASTRRSSVPGVATTAWPPRRIHLLPTLGLGVDLHLVHEHRRLVVRHRAQQLPPGGELGLPIGILRPQHRAGPPPHQNALPGSLSTWQ